MAVMRAGCNTGYHTKDITKSACQPCPAGTYTDSAGEMECVKCPELLTTTGDASSSLSACSVCVEGTCHGHGQCVVEFGSEAQPTPSCSCDFGYSQSSNCEEARGYIILGTVLGSVVLLVLLYFVVRHLWRRMHYYKIDASLQEKLLSDSQSELKELERVWQIQPSEVELVKVIGHGSYGEVWHGFYQSHEVAVKKLHQSLIELDESFIQYFEKEIKFQRTLRHSNIVFFYGAGYDQQKPFIVSEFCARGNLRENLNNPAIELPWVLKLHIVLGAAKGLAFLHKIG